MTATFAQAYDEILTIFKTAWDGNGYTALYENVAGNPPTTQQPWARVTTRDGLGSQTLSNGSGASRYDRRGVLIVQIFVPVGQGLAEAKTLCKTLADAFEGQVSPLGVWFRNARSETVGPDGEWHQTNFIVEYSYDEVK